MASSALAAPPRCYLPGIWSKQEPSRRKWEHELHDIYDAENKLTNALEKMAKDASDETLSQAFAHHRQVTQQQIQRLERVFELVERAPRREPCAGINGLIEEYREFTKEEDPSPEVRDVFATGAALKVESYEISAYKSMIGLAKQLGLTEATSLLEQSLREENEAALEVEQMSEVLGKRLP
jgi:ferritin-like metal-binding protein YciE